MDRIKIMSEDLSNKIAAGEVVERIANVIKELTENSIDAQSTEISVSLKNAGSKEIKVMDNGIGMDPNDALNAFKRHATSKIYKPEDLFFINTLGFRGEALPSIASVSKVTLETSEGDVGTKIVIEGGKLIENTKCAARKGTLIKVNDLFYNTPARLKYLKSEQTELSNTTQYMEKLALSYPEIAFTLTNNDTTIIKTTGSGNLLKCIHELYGQMVSKNMLEIKGTSDDYDVYGYICKPVVLKSNRNYMTTIVNGRVVRNAELNKAINDAYHTYKPDIRYPVVVIKIETDPTLIDVNIHPTKQDIKFSKIDTLINLTTKLIKNALYNSLLIPKIEITKPEENAEATMQNYQEITTEENPSIEYSEELFVNNDLVTTFNEPKIEETQMDFKLDEKNEEVKHLELYPCGLVFGTYIVAQNEESMYLIDQHAAQERINYEKVLKALREEKITITDLLFPISVELSPSDYLAFKEKEEIFKELGFNFEEFGINTIIVKSHPTWLITGYEEEQIRKIIDFLISTPTTFERAKFQDHLAATAACKMSVKGNEATTTEQAENLLNDLVKCDNPYNCPHGRPTIISFTRYELERMFKRVMN